jgi:hypothetical protein
MVSAVLSIRSVYTNPSGYPTATVSLWDIENYPGPSGPVIDTPPNSNSVGITAPYIALGSVGINTTTPWTTRTDTFNMLPVTPYISGGHSPYDTSSLAQFVATLKLTFYHWASGSPTAVNAAFNVQAVYIDITFTDASVIRYTASFVNLVPDPRSDGFAQQLAVTAAPDDLPATLSGTQYGGLAHGWQPFFFQLSQWVPGLPLPAPSWLIIREPGIGYTDQTWRMDNSAGQQGSFRSMIRQRGTADIPLRVHAGDIYEPTIGTQVLLYDQTPPGLLSTNGIITVWAGTIDRIELTWDGTAGERIYHLTAVSFEQTLDTVVVPPQRLQGFAGDIVTTLFTQLMHGAPISLGTISPGKWIVSLVIGVDTSPYPSVADVVKQLAVLSLFIWYVDPVLRQLNFCLPNTTVSPFNLTTSQVLWGTLKWDQNRADYRNRQILQIAASAFQHSSEQFTPASSGQTVFGLRNMPSQITDAWTTFNTQNTAVGTFTGVPAANDTITIGYPNSSSIYNWAANSPYRVGQTVIDALGHLQQVTIQGTSGGSPPTWNDAGSTTSDGPGTPQLPDFTSGVIWQDLGIPGGFVYTWVTTINNENWGEVLIGATATDCAANLVAAINADVLTAGVLFSLPTWEHALVNADAPAAGVFTIRNKSAGAGYVAALSESTANFSWSAGATSGGATNFNTVRLNVAQANTSNTADLYWQPGNKSVACVTAPGLVSGRMLAVEYTRLGGDCIQVEDTVAVNARALIEAGTGKYQRVESDTAQTSNVAGLLEAKQALEAYKVIPISFSFETDVSGLSTGQYLTFTVSDTPPGIQTLINAPNTWVIQEIQAAFITGPNPDVAAPWLNQATVPGAGHYHYTVTVINAVVIGSYLDFWEGLSGGGSSAGSGATGSQGGVAGGTSATALQVNGTVVATEPSLDLIAGTNITIVGADDSTSARVKATVNAPTMVGDSGSGGAAGAVPAPGAGDAAAGKFVKADGTWAVPPGTAVAPGATEGVLGIVIDGGGSIPATGSKGFIQIPYAGTITGWTILVNASGSCQITVKKSTYSGFPTTASIVASAPPVLTTAQKATSTTLTGWTTALALGDVLEFNLDSVTTSVRIILELQVTKT